MRALVFPKSEKAALTILCLGAHSDDIEIGCGGTLLRLIKDYPNSSIYWIILGSNQERREEALASAEQFLEQIKDKTVAVAGFRDGFFPYLGRKIKEYLEEIRQRVEPDIVFTHYGKDLHQDHSLLSELTWNTFRDHVILEYEIPKYDGDIGSPNFFVHLDEDVSKRKVKLILTHFTSQNDKHWFTEDTFLALMRLRGVESRSPSRYAEAFYCRKVVV